MDFCKVCNIEDAKYKCPNCKIQYCSIACFKTHKEKKCDNKKTDKEDIVPSEKLKLLDESLEIKNMLTNRHLIEMLLHLDKCGDPERILQNAIKVPIFREFVVTCLKTVENDNESNKS